MSLIEKEIMMKRQYKIGQNRHQAMLLPPSIEEYVPESNPVRAIDAYVDTLAGG
jgi:hypothetical protein